MEENLNVVNDTQGLNVESQTEVQETGANDSQVADVKPVQTPEQNSEFAKVRREAEAKARERADNFAKKYGYNSFEEMERADAEREAEEQRQQFREQNGFDPDAIKPLFEQFKESDPDFQELQAIRAEKNATKALSDLNRELEDAGLDLKLADLSETELRKIPNIDKVTEYVSGGHSLADAFFLANKKEIISGQVAKVQQETIKKINSNAESSPGSLSGGGEVNNNSVYSKSKSDFQKMIDEVMRGERKTL